jgi:hypothetical protein
MAAQQYRSASGVVITVELVEDEESEYAGLYRTTDKDKNVGHITKEQLDDNFTVLPAQPANTKG